MTYAEPENFTGLNNIFKYANDVTNGFYTPGILIGLWIIIFSFLKIRAQNTSNCAIVASFITVFVSLFFFLLEYINNWHFLVSVLALALSLIWGYFDKD